MNASRCLILIAGLMVCARALAADTNDLYLPLVRPGVVGEAAVAEAYREQVEAARRLPECRPAQLDPEGHWGEIAAGLQLGVRVTTNTFRAGEPIDMVAILRNTTTNVVAVPYANRESIDWFVLKDNQPLAPVERAACFSKSRSMLVLPPLNQKKYYPDRLSYLFDLNAPGVYRVYAKCGQSKLAPDLPEIKSGVAEIKVVGQEAK